MNMTVEGFPQIEFATLITSMSYSLTVTAPANTYILWLILREGRLTPDIFYFNLSSGELYYSLFAICTFFVYQYSCIPCFDVAVFFNGLFYTARPLFQCLICLECYVGVNHPVWFLRLKPLRYRLTCCALSWLLITVFCIYYQYTFTNKRHLFTFFIQNLVILLAALFCLVSVLRTLQRPGPGENNLQKKSNRTKARAFRILSLTMAIMTVNFLLLLVPIPLQLFLAKSKFWLIYDICMCLSLIIGSMQPLIYLQRSERILCFRRH